MQLVNESKLGQSENDNEYEKSANVCRKAYVKDNVHCAQPKAKKNTGRNFWPALYNSRLVQVLSHINFDSICCAVFTEISF